MVFAFPIRGAFGVMRIGGLFKKEPLQISLVEGDDVVDNFRRHLRTQRSVMCGTVAEPRHHAARLIQCFRRLVAAERKITSHQTNREQEQSREREGERVSRLHFKQQRSLRTAFVGSGLVANPGEARHHEIGTGERATGVCQSGCRGSWSR